MAKSKPSSDDYETPDTRPCFCKIMFPVIIDLRIPPAFKEKYLMNEESERAVLRSPCGSWNIKLQHENEADDTYFRKGWQTFVEHHSLGDSEFLIFKYNGKMCFDVTIYDKNGCKKNHHSLGTSSCFTSSLPFFESSMKDYSIGSKSCLLIPKAFSKKYIPQATRIVLRNSKGSNWDANIILNSSKLFSISAGWKAFADDNALEKGDICIFELVDEYIMQVHIFK
ncbi:hypothetical protein BUALT_Bualt15G0031500 [Buddleja alternifolia]|uniref:TF-B3 domain-containing protein n=1 Tax=Buddleja alternifolia TaxID=168488 RepID=A0AAV6WIP7_9LAMI|nr:hypothetical protein BUALT_Bualt15G0031500 [Buddleja alternifolia]